MFQELLYEGVYTLKIGQLSEQAGLSTYTIRYYEKMGLIEKPTKDSSGHRHYEIDDLKLINWVSCLKNSGMPLQKIREYTAAYRAGKETVLAEILSLHLNKLRTQQEDIEHYIDVTSEKLGRLKKRLT